MADTNPLAWHTAPRHACAGFFAERSGGLALITLLTPTACAWREANVVGEASWAGEALAVEMRYFPALADAIVAADFTFERESFAN